MDKKLVFTIRLTEEDWDSDVRAWDCAALDIPGAYIETAFDKGQVLDQTMFKIDHGPARVRWLGSRRPQQIRLVVGLGEPLTPKSAEEFWKRLAIVVPIITAIITATATYLTKPGPGPVPNPHVLSLQVLPNDLEVSGLPPARVTMNSQDVKTPVDHKVTGDTRAVVDVSKAVDYARASIDSGSACYAAAVQAQKDLAAASGASNTFTSRVGGSICGGGSNGIPSPMSGSLVQQGNELTGKLQAIIANLARVQSQAPSPPGKK